MSTRREDEFFQSVIEALRQVNPDFALAVEERSEEIVQLGYHTADGAFLGAYASRSVERSLIAQAQTFSATCTSDGTVDNSRRQFLRNMALGALGTATAFSGWGVYVIDEFRKKEEFSLDDAFIRQVIDLGSDRPALHELRASMLNAGRVREAELIHLITRHGDNFAESEAAIATMQYILDNYHLSELSDTFVRSNFCTHFRYIGLPRQNYEYGQLLFDRDFRDIPKLQTKILNQRHMNIFNIFYGLSNFSELIDEDTERLSQEYSALVGAPIFGTSPEHIGLSLGLGLETFALSGIAHTNRVICCNSASEAESAFVEMAPILNEAARRASNLETDYMKVRCYGEALWPIGRIAPFAIARGWEKFADTLIDVFFDGFQNASLATQKLHAQLHEIEMREQRSPVWIQMAILKAARQQQADGNGEEWLERLIPQNKRHRVYGHAVLARALNSLDVYFGKDPQSIFRRFALAQSESSILLDAVSRLARG